MLYVNKALPWKSLIALRNIPKTTSMLPHQLHVTYSFIILGQQYD